MGRRTYEEDRDNPEPEKGPPVEPNGFELTRKHDRLNDTKQKMQSVADEITRLLQEEQRRQDKYKENDRAAGN